MTFDKSRVYTALNAEELEVGSEVILANYLESLKQQVEANSWPTYTKRLDAIMGTSSTNRFKSGNRTYNLAYLVRKVDEVESEEEEKKWIVYLARGGNGKCYLTACREDRWEDAQEDYGAKTKLYVGAHNEVNEWYKSRQKFFEVIKAWEDGKQIQYWDKQRGYWFDVNEPTWNLDKEYRVKPNWIVYIARYRIESTLCCCAESCWGNAKKFDGAKTKLFVGSEGEAKEWCSSRQKLTETIKAWEDGNDIQVRSSPADTWSDCVVTPEWNDVCEYRVKPDELVWTDLKIGDILVTESDGVKEMVVGIDPRPNTGLHVCLGGMDWIDDGDLKEWRKAE